MRALPLLLLLGACAGKVIDAPSLSPRAVEKSPVPLPDDPSEPQIPADAALLQTIAGIEAGATQGHAAFVQAQAAAETAVSKAANAAPGSEEWTVAQQQLSILDATRGPVAHASAEIDALRNDPANAASGNRTAIEAASQRIEVLSQTEADAMTRLGAGLKG